MLPSTLGPLISASLSPPSEFPRQCPCLPGTPGPPASARPPLSLTPWPPQHAEASLLPPHATWGPRRPSPGRRGARRAEDSGHYRVGHFARRGAAGGLDAQGLLLGRGVEGLKAGPPPPPGRELTFFEAGAGVYNYCPPPRQRRRPGDRPRWRWRRGKDSRCRHRRLRR